MLDLIQAIKFQAKIDKACRDANREAKGRIITNDCAIMRKIRKQTKKGLKK